MGKLALFGFVERRLSGGGHLSILLSECRQGYATTLLSSVKRQVSTEPSVIGEQNNTCVPAERARESAERRSYTMSGAALAHDDSRMLSGLRHFVVIVKARQRHPRGRQKHLLSGIGRSLATFPRGPAFYCKCPAFLSSKTII